MPPLTKAFSAPVLFLVFARVLYAINWFNISSVFYLILIDFEQDISMLGIITASFLVGIGVFQVPAGILAAKYNPKKIALSGIMMLSVASLLSGLATEPFQMVILRFLVGVGMAFFFGPSVILISSFLGKGSEGLGVGILNSAHSLGGIIGLFGWIIVAEAVGWRASLIIGGMVGVVSGLFLVYEMRKNKEKGERTKNDGGGGGGGGGGRLPSHHLKSHLKDSANQYGEEEDAQQQPNFKIRLSDLKVVLTNKSMIFVGLSLLGVQIGWNLVSTFIILYLKNDLHASASTAGLIGGLAMLCNVLFAPIFGRLYDGITKRSPDRNHGLLLLIICSAIISVNITLFSLANVNVIVFSTILIGIFASGGFVVPYAKAREIVKKQLHQPPYETLAVSFVNGLSLFGAFWVPFVFSITVIYFGYPLAWVIGGIITLTFVIPSIKLAVK
jgi:MFS family permease